MNMSSRICCKYEMIVLDLQQDVSRHVFWMASKIKRDFNLFSISILDKVCTENIVIIYNVLYRCVYYIFKNCTSKSLILRYINISLTLQAFFLSELGWSVWYQY